MSLLPPVTRDQVAPDLLPLWDECARSFPAFANLWQTMAHSPTIFRHIWGELLELKRTSPVAGRHFEIGIVVVSALNACAYCVSHHAPLAEAQGLTPAQLRYLRTLRLEAPPGDHAFAVHPGFDPEDGLVIDLAWFLVWAGTAPHLAGVHPSHVHRRRRRLFARLAEHFTPRQIEELTWRIAQCVAFNWHNDFLELDMEPTVPPLAPAGSGPEHVADRM